MQQSFPPLGGIRHRAGRLKGGFNLFAGRGFTSHEHLPEFGLINMNGRMYDPVLGRFLSPDN